MSNKLIRVEGKLYQKTAAFGNWKAKTIFKNLKRYNRKRFNAKQIDAV